jgi:hypothetical protein
LPNSGNGQSPSREKVDRALRRVYIYVGALAGTIFVLLTWILLAILQQSEDNGRISEDNNKIVAALVDCRTKGSECSDRQLEIIREAAEVIGSENIDASVAAVYCLKQPEVKTLRQIHRCVHRNFNQLKREQERGDQ